MRSTNPPMRTKELQLPTGWKSVPKSFERLKGFSRSFRRSLSNRSSRGRSLKMKRPWSTDRAMPRYRLQHGRVRGPRRGKRLARAHDREKLLLPRGPRLVRALLGQVCGSLPRGHRFPRGHRVATNGETLPKDNSRPGWAQLNSGHRQLLRRASQLVPTLVPEKAVVVAMLPRPPFPVLSTTTSVVMM